MMVKVCGMRHPDNIKAVEATGIDLMGFVFYPNSPRYVAVRPEYLPTQCKRVGVFVDETTDVILERCQEFGLDGVQLHGHETPEMCQTLRSQGLMVLKAFGIPPNDGHLLKEFLATLASYEGVCDYFVFDTATAAKGGSGKQFDWNCLADYAGSTPFLLSGGINPASAERIRSFDHPLLAGIDLNSGFEISPALKDSKALTTFLSRL